MRAPLSIIIPTLNAAEALAAGVACLFEGLEVGLVRELILSDGGSTDAIGPLADELGATLITGAPGRGGQMRRGAEAAGGDWLLFLHADTALDPGWAAVVIQHIADHPDQAACFRLRFRADGIAPRIFAGWANLRSRVLARPFGDQGMLISRSMYDAVGGFRDIPLMEDVAMARALQGRLRVLPHVAVTSAGRYQAEGWLRRGCRNLWMQARFAAGVAPETLARDYRRGRDGRGD